MENFESELKSDESPLTKADKLSHSIICNILESSKLPALSEEGKEIDYSERKKWNQFWLVDPIDGTKEFIKRNGEFTVNIALIENRHPIIGVIYVPFSNKLYVVAVGIGAYKIVSSDSNISFSKIRESGIGWNNFLQTSTKTPAGLLL